MINQRWISVLAENRPTATHMHMWQAAGRSGPFSGWTQGQVESLAEKLCELLREIHRTAFFEGFRFTMDLGAHRKWAGSQNLPHAPKNLVIGTLIAPCGGILHDCLVSELRRP
jgi:hypothetical protein